MSIFDNEEIISQPEEIEKEIKGTGKKDRKKFPYYSILFYLSFFLVVLFIMIILKPKCVGLVYRECISEEIYYLVFTPAIYIVFVSMINFVKKHFSK